MALLSNLKIAHRVLLLALVALAGLAAVSAIFLAQRQIEAGYRAEADRLVGQQVELTRLRDDVRDALVATQTFLLTRETQAAERFQASHASATARVDTLTRAATAAQATELSQLETGLGTYAKAFDVLVRKDTELGLTPDTGLEGAMREAVHSIEKQLETAEDAELRVSMLMLRRHEKDFILRRNADYIEKHAAEAEKFSGMIKKVFKPGAQRMRVMEALDVYANAFRLYAKGTLEEAAARKELTGAYDALQPVLAGILDHYARDEAATKLENARISSRNLAIVTALICLAVGLILVCVLIVGRSISRPILSLVGAMGDLAGGDTSRAAPGLGRRDEVGRMAKALEVFRESAIERIRLEDEAAQARANAETERTAMQEEAEARAREHLRRATGALASALHRLAGGDLSFTLSDPFAPDFEALRADLNAALAQLSGVMTEIAFASHRIDEGSREISGGAHALAQRTERQAVALEETAAALDEITVNVKRSATRVEEARDVADRARGSTGTGTKLVDDAVQAMGRIETSSQRISTIIAVIDQIAFQTNLLALNAGVEAARAGEAGRGFAVVAHEVRELAQRSANAAKEIKTLIESAAGEVEEGARHVRDTGAALHEIGRHVTAMNEHMQAIAIASQEQSAGLAQINAAVNQMDHDTQQNAAMVEESNAATAVLANEAARLRASLSAFRLRDENAGREPMRLAG